MGPGPKGKAGIEIDRHLTPGGRLLPLPLRNDIKPLPHSQGLIILLPAGGPVVLPKGSGGIGGVDPPHPLLPLGLSGGVVRDIKLYPADPLHRLQQVVVHIVPILAVLLQKGAEIGLILQDQAGDSIHGELGRQSIQLFGSGVYRDLKPFLVHLSAPFPGRTQPQCLGRCGNRSRDRCGYRPPPGPAPPPSAAHQ